MLVLIMILVALFATPPTPPASGNGQGKQVNSACEVLGGPGEGC